MQEFTNLFEQLFLSTQMWGYLGPLAIVAVGLVAAKKDKLLGVMWFMVECLFMWHYLQLVAATPEYYWHLLILVLGGLATCIYPLFDR